MPTALDQHILAQLTVADAMRREIHSVPAEASLVDAAALMRDLRVAALAVRDPRGTGPAIITERDIVCAVSNQLLLADQTVADHQTSVLVAGAPRWSLARAIETMTQGGFRHLVVVEDNATIGMVSMRDIMIALSRQFDDDPVVPESTAEFHAVDPNAARLLGQFRRDAKQHQVAAKCFCELDWLEVLAGQLEERPALSVQELRTLWDRREPCPRLHASGGGAD